MDKLTQRQSLLMEATKPVFVVGVARSGTSILYRILQHHASFRLANCAPGFDLTESRVFVDPASVYVQTGNAFQFMLCDARQYQQFREAVKTIPPKLAALYSRRSIRRLTNRTQWTRVWWWKLCQNHHLMRSFFSAAEQARGGARLVEKTPANLTCLPELKATFPQAKVICTCRHPVDVYSSYRRRLLVVQNAGAVDPKTIEWLTLSPRQFCNTYRAGLQKALRAYRVAPDDFLLTRYEDFTREPAHWFRRICDFINEPYEAACLQQAAPSLSQWQQDPLLALPIGANTKLWSDYMSESTAILIETALPDIMQAVGYASYTRAHEPRSH
ncbi:hypothetical protein BH10CHL1_BH10CHL1_07900 [soil metagenome]